MNYFDLINKCLVELNYKTVKNFSELVKNDHLKIKNIMNIINAEVCGLDKWNFTLRKTQLTLPEGDTEIENTIDGRIQSLTIDKIVYGFCPEFDKFLLNTQPEYTFSALNSKLLFKKFQEDKTLDVIYYTNKCAKNADGDDIQKMTSETDSTIIPEPFSEPILVYGTCMRLKANPQYAKFNYWYGMYKDSLMSMRSRLGTCINEVPNITLYRK